MKHLLKLYMPLVVMQYELGETPTELDHCAVLTYHNQILLAIINQRNPEEIERGLMLYYYDNDSLNRKVISLFFTVEQVGSNLMGVAECLIQGILTDSEYLQLKKYVSGQASDGFGEGFEQHKIQIGINELYVSLWSSLDDWNIMTYDQAIIWAKAAGE